MPTPPTWRSNERSGEIRRRHNQRIKWNPVVGYLHHEAAPYHRQTDLDVMLAVVRKGVCDNVANYLVKGDSDP